MKQGIKEKDIRDFEKYAKKLDEVMIRIREYKPEANIYAAGESLYLMSGFHHDPYGEKSNEDAIVSSVMINGMDSGDW